jgi:four helix bundle protein
VANHFSELICWQLGRDLRKEVFRLSASRRLVVDLKFRSQLNDAASSVCANIAEGFGRRSHKDFAHFLDISRSSVNEVENRLMEAVERQYVSQSDIAEALPLVIRVRASTSRLMAYLCRTGTPNSPGRRT